jgi:putative ABC transport system permease protein
MKWRNVAGLYLTRLRVTLVPELLASVGIAVGVALLFASNVSGSSLDHSIARLSGSLLGTMRLQVMSRSSHGFDERTVQDVRALPGVRLAAPVLEQQIEIAGPSGSRAVDLVGSEPRFARLGSAIVRHFTTTQLARIEALALPEATAHAIGVGTLQPVVIQAGGRRHEALVGLELTSKDSPLLAESPIAIAPLAYAQQLTGLTGRVTRIFVSPAPGRERQVKAELARLAGSRLNVRSASYDAQLFAQAATPTDQSTQLFSAISALVGLLFAVYAMLLTVPHRRALIHDLRLTGYRSREVAKILAFDALVLGLLASAGGLGFGELLSRWVFHVSPGYLAFAFPVGTQRVVTAASVLLAVGAAMLTALIGVFAPVRDIFGPFKLHGASESKPGLGASHLAAAAGAVCFVLSILVLAAAPQLALLGMASLTLALLMLLPAIFDLAVAAFDRAGASVIGSAPALAVMELQDRGNRLRSLAIAVTGAIAVFGSVSISSAQHSLQRGLDEVSHDLSMIGAVWISPVGGYNELVTTAFAPLPSHTLRALQAVGAVSVYRGSFLDIGSRRAWVLAPPLKDAHAIPASQLVEGDLAQASRRLARGGWLVVSRALAVRYGLHVGSSFTLPSPRPVRLKVAAVSTNLGWVPGAVILNAGDYARAWNDENPSAYIVTPPDGVSAAAAAARIRTALGHGHGLGIETARHREVVQRATSRRGLARLSEISTLVLTAAVIAMATAMATVIWQRRPQLAHLQVDGFDRRTLWRALLLETTVLLGTGCCLGALFGMWGQLLLSRALANVTGFPVVFSSGGLSALVSFGLVTVVAVGIVAIPGHFAARVRPAVAFED